MNSILLSLFVVNLILCCCIIFQPVYGGGSIFDDITKCHYEDPKCMMEVVPHVAQKYAKTGIKDLNLPPFDPLRINSLKLDKNEASSVNIELKFKDLDIYGIQNLKLLSIKGFDAAMAKNIEMQSLIPKLTLKGLYSVDGKVVILPIVGKGNAEIHLDDVHFAVTMHPKPVEISGHTHLQLDKMKMDLKPKHVGFKLDGLFNENKELGDNMNAFLNENWADVFNELKGDMSVALGEVAKHIFNTVFSKYPYDVFFLS